MSDILAVRNDYREQEWAQIIQECQESGLSQKEFCQQRNISDKKFYYWLRKLRDKAIAAATAPELVPVDLNSRSSEMIYIKYRGAELNLPEQIGLDMVISILKSLQTL